ncbi:uncharacterized protein LOC122019708 isoform X2 [Zingiber officinale]|uniref:uncharacterized protein LOC122019708 isoform X2 n=1 Tax=Zingiber officinale TaxID=94328 RepID=UPI001C4C5431|nr:uncharacterized protein LOC122019708 isoform X2 [Zingiber officinale]
MSTVPCLFNLCVGKITTAIIHGHELTKDIIELPPDLFDNLVRNLSPLALQNIHEFRERSADHSCEFGCKNASFECRQNCGRPFYFRCEDFNTLWMMLFMTRWSNIKRIHPSGIDGNDKSKLNQSLDWQQLYWEKHLQDVLDEAAEKALLPSFDANIGDLTISDSIMDAIGHRDTCCCMKLSFHCNRFGKYMRYLRLQNVLCVAETCELLRGCKLQSLVLRRVISKTQVDGLLMLLKQHRHTLRSLEFIFCHIPSAIFEQFFGCMHIDGSETHGIHDLYIKSSRVFDNKSSLVPSGLLPFLVSGRDLHSLCICDSKLQAMHAKLIFDVLVESSSPLVTLEISENNLAGWLSRVVREPLDSSSFIEPKMPLKSLRELTLRGNNLKKEDAEDLCYILVHMPVLQCLDISDNAIMDGGIRSLIPYFIWALLKDYPLTDIKLNNCNLSCSGVANLLRSLLPIKTPLNTFSVAENELGSFIAAPLAKFLASPGVRKLNIEDIGLGILGFQQLEDQIPRETALQYINISKNRGGNKAACFISKALLYAPNITCIKAGGNIMPPESVEVIYRALKESRDHGTCDVLNNNGVDNRSACNHARWSLTLQHVNPDTSVIYTKKVNLRYWT